MNPKHNKTTRKLAPISYHWTTNYCNNQSPTNKGFSLATGFNMNSQRTKDVAKQTTDVSVTAFSRSESYNNNSYIFFFALNRVFSRKSINIILIKV